MDIYSFMSESPWLTFFIALILAELFYRLLFGLPNRILRHLNIKKHGWPPEHCDADGDFKPENDDKFANQIEPEGVWERE